MEQTHGCRIMVIVRIPLNLLLLLMLTMEGQTFVQIHPVSWVKVIVVVTVNVLEISNVTRELMEKAFLD